MSRGASRIWAFAGAGGKTTSIYRIAERLRREKFRVLVTTTTHMELPEDPCFAPGEDAAQAVRLLRSCGYAIAGLPLPENDHTETRMGGIPEEAFRILCGEADFVLVEADGSARHPFKVPAVHEPVIPEGTERIFLCEGLTAAGRTAAGACHRAGSLCALLGESLRPEELILTEQRMAEGIRGGYLRRFSLEQPGLPVTVLLNQADTALLRTWGARVKSLLERGWLPGGTVTEILSWNTGEGTKELPWKFI